MYECLKVGKEASQKMIQTYFQAQVGTGASKQNKQTNKTTNKPTKTDKQTSASKQTIRTNKT